MKKMKRTTICLTLCLALMLTLLTACGNLNAFGSAPMSAAEGGCELQSMTTESFSNGEAVQSVTMHYAANGLVESIESGAQTQDVEYTFDDNGSPVTIAVNTEDDPFSAELEIDYGGITTVALKSLTVNGETGTDFSSPNTLMSNTFLMIFRLIEHFDAFRNATLYVPDAYTEQRMADGEVVYLSTHYDNISTTTEILHNPDGGTTTVISTDVGGTRSVQSITADAERCPIRYSVSGGGNQIAFDIAYTENEDGSRVGMPENIDVSGEGDGIAELQQQLGSIKVCRCAYEDGKLTMVEQYQVMQASESDNSLLSAVNYDAQGRMTQQTTFNPLSGEKLQVTTCTYQ